jgi:serine/threonine-protein kinase/endoribonuclease IRE1
LTDLGSIGIAVYDILLPLTPAEAKPIIVPQPPVRLESLFPLPDQPEQRHFDILAKSPSTYIGSVPYQLTLPASESDETRPPPPRRGDKPLLYALSSSSYPLINFAPPARPGAQANGSFPLSADLPERDQLLPYLLDPAEDEKTIDPAPNDYVKDMQRGARAGRSWIFWTIGVLAALIMVAAGIFGLGRRKNIKQTATPPSEKEPLLVRNDPQPTYTEDNQTPQVPDKLESEIVDKDKEIKPKKKNARRRVRGKKKRDDDDGDDKSSIGSPSVRGEKPLPDLPRAISTVALQDENDKERLVISKDPIGASY